MDKRKYITIGIAVGLFLFFSAAELIINRTYDVLEIITPFDIIVDFNGNGVEDYNELVHILDGYEYINREKISEFQDSGLDEYSLYAMSYLTENFAKNFLQDKKVHIKKKKNIFVGTESYNEALLKSGYIFQKHKPVDNTAFNKRLHQIKSADFKLYNAKSNKYHCLTCKYGLMSHNYVILSKYQIPKGAKPCKYCLNHDSNRAKTNPLLRIPDVKQPPLVLSHGVVKLYLTDFTRKLKPDKKCNTLLCKELVTQINSAKYSIDIAIYGYDKVPAVEKAIKNAIARGVVVRLVYDIDNRDTNIYGDTKEFISIIKNVSADKAPENYSRKTAYSNSIMHNKFYIFDKSIVMTGSANLSATDMSGFNSNSVILIKSKRIAEIYTKEFEQMYNSKFHDLKSPIYSKENINIGGTVFSIYFSPTDSAIEKVIVPLVNNAKKYIYMPVFLITDKRLAAAIINAKNRGVDIRVIVDAANASSKYSKHRLFRQHGIKVKTENLAGKLHSKSMIIDDKITVIGSMNFSKSGEHKNDENLIVIKDPVIAGFYKTFFNYLWNRIHDYWLTHDVRSESRYSIGSCSDGIDNDYDGLIDSADEGCKIKHTINSR